MEDYDPERVWAIVRSWAGQRSRIERTGNVECEEWIELLDVERALRLMAAGIPRDDPRWADPMQYDTSRRELREVCREMARAAGLIASMMLLGYRSSHDLAFAFGGGDERNRRSLDRAKAWLACYLAGGTLAEAETAFRA